MEEITIQTIISSLENWVKTKKVIDSHTWVDACQKMNVLVATEHDKLFELQQQVAILKVQYIEAGDTVAKSKVKVEASDLYKEACKQKAFIGRVEEMIRISKLQARLKDSEMRNY